jgi:hypothetical protein
MSKKKNTTIKMKKRISGRKIKGGLKQKDPSLTSWQAVYKMISNPASTLTKISYSSLKGYIFKLDVPPSPANSEFFGLNVAGTDFNVPIYSLIFKFAIISEGGDEELPEFSFDGELDSDGNQISYTKATENLNDFETESDIQQSIYLKTINPSGKPICLAVADFSYFDTASAGTLLGQLRAKPGNSPKVLGMLDYLMNTLNSNEDYQLGMITMELANSDFKELSDLKSNEDVFERDCNSALAQILILFTKLKILNYDSHAGNVLGKEDGTKTFLIDFGRTLNFQNRYRNPFPAEGRQIVDKYTDITKNTYELDKNEVLGFDVTALWVSGKTTEEIVIDRMQKIIKFMAYIDYCTNSTYFDMTSMDRPQLITFLRYLYGPEFSDKWTRRRPNFKLTPYAKERYASLIPTIRSLTEGRVTATNRLSENAVQGMMQTGKLFSIQPGISYDRSNVSGWSKPGNFSDVALGRAGISPHDTGLRQRPGRGQTYKCADNEDDEPNKQSCCDRITNACRSMVGLGGRRTKKRGSKKRFTKTKRGSKK